MITIDDVTPRDKYQFENHNLSINQHKVIKLWYGPPEGGESDVLGEHKPRTVTAQRVFMPGEITALTDVKDPSIAVRDLKIEGFLTPTKDGAIAITEQGVRFLLWFDEYMVRKAKEDDDAF